MSAVMETELPVEEQAEEEPKPKGKKKLLLIILIVLFLGGGGGGAFYWFKVRAAAKAAAAAAAQGEHAKKEGEEDEHEKVKTVVELQPFIINLADTDEARYLRMTINLGIGEEEGGEKPDPVFTTRVRDAVLAVISTKTSQALLTVEGKDALRKELLERLRKAVPKPEIKAIYITDFIIQL